MKSMRRTLLIVCVVACLLSACKPTPHTPVAQTTYDTLFTSGYEKMHGAYYPGLDNQVVSIDLYSEGLKLGLKGIVGTGTNLFFSDVFLSGKDSTLQAGTYLPSDSGEASTFLSGKYFEGNFTGAYLLLIENNKLMSYSLLPEGTLTAVVDGDITDLRFEGKMQNGKAYKASYRGKLKLEDAR